MKRRRAAWACLGAYAVLGLVSMLGLGWVSGVAYGVLMPLLVGYVGLVAARRTRVVVLTTVGLLWSWLGDLTGGFLLLKIGLFLLAQTAYATAFWPLRRRSVAARPVLLVAYGLPILVLTGVVAAYAGPLALPVAVYGVAVAVMVVLATGVSRVVGAGALLFLASDIVLGISFFVDAGAIPASAVVNSALYLPAQLLIAIGVLRHTGRRGPTHRAGLA